MEKVAKQSYDYDCSYDDDYPKLSAVLKAVEARPKIAKWLKERPVTDN